jgi:hypothetical protein
VLGRPLQRHLRDLQRPLGMRPVPAPANIDV